MTEHEGSRTGDRLSLDRWVVRWHTALAASRAKGQKEDTVWGAGRVAIGAPASEAELAAVEQSSGLPIPPTMRRLFITARSVEVVWHFADDFERVVGRRCVKRHDQVRLHPPL